MTFFTEPKLLDTQRWKNMRIGILGGSFNPPHQGHVHISQMALKSMKLDAVWWLVTPLNPLKSPDELLSVEQRVALSREINIDPKIIITGIEEEFGTNYSYATIKLLKKNFPNTQFAWIAGMDNISTFHLWQNWQDFLSEMCMIHVTRHPPEQLLQQSPLRMFAKQRHVYVSQGGAFPLNPNTSYWLLQKKMVNISSSEIREKKAI